MHSVILASQSPRRKQILELADIEVEIMVANTDETYPNHLSIDEIPIYIAKEKANAVIKKIGKLTKPLIAADTLVMLDDVVISKPKDREDAINILQNLSGKKHKVITGVVIMTNENTTTFSDTTFVEFNPLTKTQIEYYIDKYKPFDKAGAYAIQEWIGAIAIKKIEGDFYNVMGLPINRIIKELEKI